MNRAFWVMCSELDLFKTSTIKPLHFFLSSQNHRPKGVRKHSALHFSLKRNVYLNQISIRRKTWFVLLCLLKVAVFTVMPFHRETLRFPLLSLPTKTGWGGGGGVHSGLKSNKSFLGYFSQIKYTSPAIPRKLKK